MLRNLTKNSRDFSQCIQKKQCKASNILYKYHDVFSLFFPVWEKVVRKYCENFVIFSEISQKIVKSRIFVFFQIGRFEKEATFYKFLRKRKFLTTKWIFLEITNIFSLFFPVWEKIVRKYRENSAIFSEIDPPPMSIFSQIDQLSAALRTKIRSLGNLVSFFWENDFFSNWERFLGRFSKKLRKMDQCV